MPFSIRNRLILAVIGLAMVPIAFVGILLGRQVYSAQHQRAFQLEREVARHISEEVSSFHDGLIEDLRMVIEVYRIHTLSPGQQRILLGALQSHNGAFQELALLDETGKERIYMPHPGVNNPNALHDRLKIEKLLLSKQSGEPYFSPVRFDENASEPLMTVSFPIMNSLNGQMIGNLVGEVCLKGIWDLISGIKLKSGENVYIVDLLGRVVAHRSPSVILRDTRFIPPGKDGLYKGLDGPISIMAVDRVRFGDQVFAVIAEREVSAGMKPAFTRVCSIIILLSACFLMVSGIGILAVRQIIRPIKALESKVFDLKKGKKALQESEKLYKNYFDSAGDMIFVQDLKGKFLDVNKVACDRIGYSKKELLKMNPSDIAIVGDTVEIKEKISKTSTEGCIVFKTEQILNDDETIHLEVSSRFIKYVGKTAILSIARDISERNRAEEENKILQAQLQHAQRMESIGTITTGVAHNFRNVLAAISVNNQLVQLKYKEDPQLQKTVGRIDMSIERGSQLVKDLMQFSRKRAKRKYEVLNLTDVLKGTYSIISESFDKKIDIYLELPELILIFGDFSSLTQVFLNFCTNARDAMPNGGELRIEAQSKGRRAEVIISDTGCGMDKETKEKCFDPFFTTKEIGKGTGLGLSTAYGILKNHGGDLHVYSKPNKGTIFKIYFPLSAVEAKNRKETKSDIIYGNGQKVLVVDDEKEMLKPMEELLGSLGYKAFSTGDAEVAIKKYKTWKPDVVLMDRNMPKMDGITCSEKILKEDPKAKIVLISGYEKKGPNGIDPRTRDFIKGYLTKPADMKELSHVLAHIFEFK